MHKSIMTTLQPMQKLITQVRLQGMTDMREEGKLGHRTIGIFIRRTIYVYADLARAHIIKILSMQ